MATSRKRPAKTDPHMGAERVRQAIQSGVTTVRGLNPTRLNHVLEQFSFGYLRDAAMLWQKIKDRDDTIKAVAEKRELGASLLNWEILPLDDSPEAEQHKQALEDFYNNLRATDALDQNKRGGVATLIRQMMHSVGHKYAVHEIVWRPDAAALTAEFRFVPLQFFENTLGRLRFLEQDGAVAGTDLEEGGWMVTCGAGIMEACSIAYLFKTLPMKAALMFLDKFGMPGLHGETSAAPGSEEWNKMRDALANFSQDWALLTSAGAKVNTIEVNTAGTMPHLEMVDRMDRAIARLWRGADLGTMSQDGSAVGANPQDSETDILEAADALIISETLQQYVDEWVIRYRFGTTPRAYFQLQPTVRINQELQLKIDDYLIRWGVPRAKKELLARYSRPEPDAGDELAAPAAAPAPVALVNEDPTDAQFREGAVEELSPAVLAAFEPLFSRLRQIAEIPDQAEQRAALERFRAALPELSREILVKVPEAAPAFERVLGPAWLDGYVAAAAAKKAPTQPVKTAA